MIQLYIFIKRYLSIRKLISTLLFLSVCAINSTDIYGTLVLKNTLSASVPSNVASAVKRMQVAKDGTIYAVTLSPSSFGKLSSDGNTYSSMNYSISFPTPTAIDFVVSGNSTLYISTTSGINGRIIRFELSGNMANAVISKNVTGTGTLALGNNGKLYSARNSALTSYDAMLSSLDSTTLSTTPVRASISPHNKYYYASNSGSSALRMTTDFTSTNDTLLGSLSTYATNVNTIITTDGALYVGTISSIRKYKTASSGAITLLWTKNYSNNLAAIALNPSGSLYTLTKDGIVQCFSPIKAVSSFSTSSSGTSIILNWTTGIADGDNRGVTIRKSASS